MNVQNSIERLKPFLYKSRQDYEENNRPVALIVLFMEIALVSILTIIVTNYFWHSINGTKSSFITILEWASAVVIIISNIQYVYVKFDLDSRIKELFKIGDKKYQPIQKHDYNKLNHIIKYDDGQLYRKYQFIEPSKSNQNEIVVEIPKEAKEITDKNTSQEMLERLEQHCIFKALTKHEMSNLLASIREYYIEKAYRLKLEKEKAFTEKQSEINAKVTTKRLKELPLFKGMNEIVKNSENEIENYHELHQIHLKENNKILNKIN